MGMFDKYMCPDKICVYRKELKKDTFCPECGAKAEKFSMTEFNALKVDKKKQKKINNDPKYAAKHAEKEQIAARRAIIHPNQPTEEILANIQDDIKNLATHEAGTKWMRIGTLLSFNTTEQMIGAGFKAIIDQNKILIRQNELILRQLQELNNEN